MARLWPIAVILLVFGGLGLSNALKPARGESAAASEVQARLDRVPLTVGGWAGVPTTIPEKHLRVAEAQAHLSRAYTHAKSRAAVSVMVLYGEPGALGAHTPETCYEGSGARQLGTARARGVGGADFWACRFETADSPPRTLSVLWSWGAGGAWRASDNPRFDFAGHRAITKLYVTRVLPPAPAATPTGPDVTNATEADPVDEFLPPFLKELQASLSTPTAPSAEVQAKPSPPGP